MNRGAFLFGALAASSLRSGDREIPVELRGGRFFAVPRTRDGRTFACWLDTDGGGFIFDAAVDTFHLEHRAVGGKERASLPPFGSPSIPAPAGTGDLPVFERSAADRADPILAGFEAQLGRTWFEGRTWRFDWRATRCTMLAETLNAPDANVPLRLEGGYTRISVTVDGEAVPMTFDIAASLASPGASPKVVATTFVTRALLERWHSAHPDWQFRRNAGLQNGIDEITVPEIRVGTIMLRNVACTTRPDDDVFKGESVSGKLGANALAQCVAVLDYRTSRLRLC